jgi:hypothetical protein
VVSRLEEERREEERLGKWPVASDYPLTTDD